MSICVCVCPTVPPHTVTSPRHLWNSSQRNQRHSSVCVRSQCFPPSLRYTWEEVCVSKQTGWVSSVRETGERERQGECQHDKWHKSNYEDCRLRKNDRAREKEKMRVRMKWKPILHLLSLCPFIFLPLCVCMCVYCSSIPNKREGTVLDLKGQPVLWGSIKLDVFHSEVIMPIQYSLYTERVAVRNTSQNKLWLPSHKGMCV